MSKTSAAAARALTSDFFALFGLPRAYALDAGRLEQAYRDIQARVHPDRFAHAGDAERRASMQMSTTVNDAYRTLKNPVLRARHLLELDGVDVAFETDTAMPPDFLMQQMEYRERLEEAKSADALELLSSDLASSRKSLEEEIAQRMDAEKNLQAAKTLVRKLMFFDRLAEEVNAAHDKL